MVVTERDGRLTQVNVSTLVCKDRIQQRKGAAWVAEPRVKPDVS